MNASDWKITKQLFDQAMDVPVAQRASFLISQQGIKQAILDKVQAMLAQHTEEKQETLSNIVDANAIDLFQAQQVFNIGEQVEQFVIDSKVGEGGMGAVFRAYRNAGDFAQDVAIKVVHHQHLSPVNELRFKQERQILASLNHKNIAGLIGGGQTSSGYPYIIMEYVEGIPITDYCLENQLDVTAILKLFKQVLSAVEFAHRNLIVHRDIKPSNVLVTKTGDVKLLDFGIARLLDENDQATDIQLTNLSVRVMSRTSAAPEQVLGEKITTATDVYGLGALLSHMLTNEPIFAGITQNAREIETLILDKTPSRPSEKCKRSSIAVVNKRQKAISTDLDTIVLHALNKKAMQRYASVEQFAQDISHYLNQYPILARKVSHWYSITKFVQRNTLSSALGVILLLGLIGFSSVISYQSSRIQQERDYAYEQAFVAKQTTQYLTDIFSAADPNQNDGETFTAKMLLDQALASVDDLNTSDNIKIELLNSLISVYQQIGQYDTASELIERAQALLQFASIDGQEKLRLSILLAHSHGSLNINLGKYEAAIILFTEQIERIRSISDEPQGLNQYYLIEAEYGLANAYSYSNHDEDSVEHYLAAIQLVKGTQFEAEMLAAVYLGYGHGLRALGRFEESKQSMLLGIEAERLFNNKDTLELAHGLNQLASTLLQLGQLNEALGYALEGLKIRQDLHQPHNVEIIASMGNVANIYAAQKRYDLAIDYRYQSLPLLEQAVGKSHPFYVIVTSATGRLHLLNQELDMAELQLLKALALYNEIDLLQHPTRVSLELALGELYLHRQSGALAMEHISTAQSVATSFLPDNHHLIALANVYLAMTKNHLMGGNANDADLTTHLNIYAQTYPLETRKYQDLLEKIAYWNPNTSSPE